MDNSPVAKLISRNSENQVSNMAQHATLLLAHGSSDPKWQAPFQELLESIRSQSRPDARIELAYMELSEPDMDSQIAKLSDEGYTRIEVLPLFFAVGRHLRKDVPAKLELLQKQHLVKLTLKPPVGLEPEVANAIASVASRAV